MRLTDAVAYALHSMRSRSLRSWLTILGIIVGITAMVVLVGMVQGLKNSVEDQLKSFGPNTLIIFPADVTKAAAYGSAQFVPTSGKLYETDYARVMKVASIETGTKVLMGHFNAEYKDSSKSISAFGVDADSYLETVGSTVEIGSGRFLTSADRRAMVMGADVADNIFDKKVELGSIISLGGERFKVVGILKKSGGATSQIDSMLLIPFDDARALLGDSIAENEISAIRLVIKDGENVDEAADQIESILLAAHRKTADNKDFSVLSQKFISQQIDQTTSILSLFLGAIAGISLLVGAVGVANTMFMAVLERRREIGILKAVGMRETEIEGLFLTEAALIGAAGGSIGLAVAAAIILLINLLGFPATILPEFAFGAVTFSAIVGIVAGYVPSRQAALQDAVEALRYE